MAGLLQPNPPSAPAARPRRGGKAVPVPDLLELVQFVAREPLAWKPVVRIPEGCDRWWTRLHADHRFDLGLLSWLPGHSTDLHDHGRSAAAFAVVRGSLTEIRVDRAGSCSVHRRSAGAATGLEAGVIHDVSGALT